MGFLSSFFDCWAIFETESSNLQFKFVDGTASEEHIMFSGVVCTDAIC